MDSHRTVIPSSILRKGSGRLTPMRLPTAEMPLRTAVSMLFIMLLEVSGTAGTLPAKSLHHASISSFLKRKPRFQHPRDQKYRDHPQSESHANSGSCHLSADKLGVAGVVAFHAV